MSDPTCSAPGCTRPHEARGYCNSHYRRIQRYGDPRVDVPLSRNVMTDPWRFISKPDGENGCWYWRDNRAGYSTAKVDGRTYPVHRLMYQLVNGPVPKGLVLDHLCHNMDEACILADQCPHRACCNPLHLQPVTHGVNIRRGHGQAGANSQKTHCDHGHEFTPENTYLRPASGRPPQRQCRKCARARWHAWKLRQLDSAD